MGYLAYGVNSGAAIGRNAQGDNYGAAVGYLANGSENGAAMGYQATGSTFGVAMGYRAYGVNNGAAIGRNARGDNQGVAVGYLANGSQTNVAIGAMANAQGGSQRIAIGNNVINDLNNTARIRGAFYMDGGTAVLYRATFGSGPWSNLNSVMDHGSLLGLADDDHTQYHNDARGDARYAGTGWDGATRLVNAQNHIARTDNPHSLTWDQLKDYGMPPCFADDDDAVGITNEVDPRVQIRANNYVPKWSTASDALITGSIYNDPSGNVGIGTMPTGVKLDVNGRANIRASMFIGGADNGDFRVEGEVLNYNPVPPPQWLQNPFLSFYYPALAYGNIGQRGTVITPAASGFYVLHPDPTVGILLHVVTIENLPYEKAGDLKIRGDYRKTSDDRIKDNEKKLEYGLAQIMELKPKRYDRREFEYNPLIGKLAIHQDKISRTNEIGFIAQELQKVIPEAVSAPKDDNKDLWSISDDTIIPVLVKAMQEQQEQIEELKKEVKSLKAGKKNI